jgi:hypothetical protein
MIITPPSLYTSRTAASTVLRHNRAQLGLGFGWNLGAVFAEQCVRSGPRFGCPSIDDDARHVEAVGYSVFDAEVAHPGLIRHVGDRVALGA